MSEELNMADKQSQRLVQVLRLHLADGFSARAIARKLGMSRNTVRRLLHRTPPKPSQLANPPVVGQFENRWASEPAHAVVPDRMAKPPRRPRDPNQLAQFITKAATGQLPPEPQDKRHPGAVALGRLGGLKGGKARTKALTPKQRSEIARTAAQARWRMRK
jgi:hypothetical protein